MAMKWMLGAGLAALMIQFSAVGVQAADKEKLKKFIDEIAARQALKGAVWGVCVKGMDGSTVASRNELVRMIPASNLKLITTGAAMHALGADFRFETGLAYTGEITDGTLKGDVYIVGGGDPTIASRDSISLTADGLFWKWKSLLKKAGIQRVDGRIIGDGRAFEGALENTSWTYDDTGTFYGCGGNALGFYANAVDYSVSAGSLGEPVKISQTYPETPWMHIENYTSTATAGSGNSLFLFTTDLAPYGEWRGTFALDRRPKAEHTANKYGALTCAYYFWKYLKTTGFEVSGAYCDFARDGSVRSGVDWTLSPEGAAGMAGMAGMVEIGRTKSAPLSQIAKITNWRSDNYFAESIFRTLGEKACGISVYDSCSVAVNEVLESLGLKASDIHIEDGSGLSRKNAVSPAFFCDFLLAMRSSNAAGDFLCSLPALGEGTLWSLLPNHPQRSRIRLKSGSMEGVLCYSGYVLDAEGAPVYVFSILTNATTAKIGDVRSSLARLLTLLLE